jgi:hypothetical protein
MSPSLKSLFSLAALTALLSTSSVEARRLQGDEDPSIREQVSRTIVRLLPPQPKPVRRFAPVPAARAENTVAIWLDRELIWSGPESELQDGIETLPFDRILVDPGLPPWAPHPLDGLELCVGVAYRIDADGHLDGEITEIDCDMTRFW